MSACVCLLVHPARVTDTSRVPFPPADIRVVYQPPINTAGEQPIKAASRDDLVAGHRNVQSLDNKASLARLVGGLARGGGHVVLLGAGGLTQRA